jgi:predicted aspartyl protease
MLERNEGRTALRCSDGSGLSIAFDRRNEGSMSLLSVAALAAIIAAAPPEPVAPPPSPMIPPASIDNSLEVTGESLAAEALRTRLFIEVKVNDKGPFRFLVDSGADRSVISLALAERLQLPLGEAKKLQGMAGTMMVPTVFIESLALGRSVIEGITAPALSGRDLGADGLIGIDALADQRLLLDFEAKTITVQDSRQPSPKLEGEIVVTARRRKGQLILTEASVGDTKVSAVIDTGSEITLGNLALQKRFLGRRAAEALPTITMLSVTGQTLTAHVATLTEVHIGGVVLKNVTIAFADAPPFRLFGLDREPALFLGSDLLESFRRVSLDFRNRKVRFVLRRQ